jgi:hypothetical protein
VVELLLYAGYVAEDCLHLLTTCGLLAELGQLEETRWMDRDDPRSVQR